MTIDYYYQVCLIYMHIKYYYNNKIYNPSLILLVPPLLPSSLMSHSLFSLSSYRVVKVTKK